MKSILVATDGSVLSNRALAKAAELARKLGTKLTIINVLDIKPVGEAFRRFTEVEFTSASVGAEAPLPMALPDSYGLSTMESIETLDNQSRAVAQLVADRILSDAKAAAKSAGVTDVEAISASGDAAHQIVSTADAIGADLIVVGRRGLSGVTELLLGSVSQKVLHQASVDLLIVA